MCVDILPHLIPNARLSITSSFATVGILVTTVDKLVETGRGPQRHGEGHLEKNMMWLPRKIAHQQ